MRWSHFRGFSARVTANKIWQVKIRMQIVLRIVEIVTRCETTYYVRVEGERSKSFTYVEK